MQVFGLQEIFAGKRINFVFPFFGSFSVEMHNEFQMSEFCYVKAVYNGPKVFLFSFTSPVSQEGLYVSDFMLK